jgi:hypothetical protein
MTSKYAYCIVVSFFALSTFINLSLDETYAANAPGFETELIA